MTTTPSRAERMGAALGRGVAFFLYDQNVVLRWVKRSILAVALAAVLGAALYVVFWAIVGILGLVVFAMFAQHIPDSRTMTTRRGGYSGYGEYDMNGNRIL